MLVETQFFRTEKKLEAKSLAKVYQFQNIPECLSFTTEHNT